MRHRRKGKKLGVNPSHRRALLANLAENLIIHKRIKTTDARAKELRRYIEPLVTKAKKGDVNSIRMIARKIPHNNILNILVTIINILIFSYKIIKNHKLNIPKCLL